jgi:lysophospholipase L1-like esterase
MAFEEWGEFGLSNMDHYMSKLYDQLSKHRIQLTVTVYPWPTQIWHGDRSSIHVEYWRDWCNERGVDFIDIFPELIPSDASAEDKLAVLNEFYLPYDMHFNARGNRLIAERFIEYYFKQFD